MKYSDKNSFENSNMFGLGQFNETYSKYFIGDSFINPLNNPNTDSIFLMNVTFEPGCRNNWHSHNSVSGGGQVLICTAGEGWYQEENREPVSLKEGQVIVIRPNMKHWHGAKKDSWFSHIAFEIPGIGNENVWYEEVDDNYYDSLND